MRLKGHTHFPIKAGRVVVKNGIKHNIDKRLKCKVCPNKSNYYCEECGVHLCLDKGKEISCWKKFHTQEQF